MDDIVLEFGRFRVVRVGLKYRIRATNLAGVDNDMYLSFWSRIQALRVAQALYLVRNEAYDEQKAGAA